MFTDKYVRIKHASKLHRILVVTMHLKGAVMKRNKNLLKILLSCHKDLCLDTFNFYEKLKIEAVVV